ncbi:metalloproteinase inhibitor 3-like [Oculina patagonica]
MSSVFSVVILLCIGTVMVCHACMRCRRTDPRDEFCNAEIVLRARVWSEPRDADPVKGDEFSFIIPDQVYSLKIIEIFKGKEKVNQLPGALSVGVRNLGLLIDLHTPTRFISCSFRLQKGKEYLLSGYIRNNKLRSSFCSLRWRWTHVPTQLRAVLNGQYSESC